MAQVSVSELELIADKLFSHLKLSTGDSIEIPVDYYWDVPYPQRYDPYTQPDQMTVGQISEDLRELRRLVEGTAEPIAYNLVWLAAVLRAVGEHTVT